MDPDITKHPAAAIFLDSRGYGFTGRAACVQDRILASQGVWDDVLSFKLRGGPIGTAVDTAPNALWLRHDMSLVGIYGFRTMRDRLGFWLVSLRLFTR